MRPTRVLAAAVLAGCAVTLSACDHHSYGVDRPHRQHVASTAAQVAPPEQRFRGAATGELAPVALATRSSAKFSTLVVNARGWTLYRSNHDSSKPSRSRCTGKCLVVWHPALVPSVDVRSTGLDERLVGTIPAGPGKYQLTLAGWPLYTFTGDHKAGQVNGQCGGVFFAVTPAGKPNPM